MYIRTVMARVSCCFATQPVRPGHPVFCDIARIMRTSRLAAGTMALVLHIAASSIVAGESSPDGGFKGRIAYSADGNFNDPDDWAASPVALAIFAESGLKERLVHFHYNCILPRNDPGWEKTHSDSVLGAVERYGYDRSRFFDCRKDLEGALAHLARAINDSSADNPLYFIVAGPMEAPVLALRKSDPEKRRFVYCISHSRWNDGFSSQARHDFFTYNKRSVIDTGVNWVQVPSQSLLATSPYRREARPEEWAPWHWMRDSDDEKVRFLWERLRISTRPDCSDAGMAYFVAAGDPLADPEKLRALLEEKERPPAIRERQQIRIEAENFREFEGYTLEDRNDKRASHALNVKMSGGDSGSIETRWREPFTASRARYDVEIAFLDEAESPARFELLINGTTQGAPWASPATGDGWTTHTIRNVEVGFDDEITLRAQGAPGRLDYVQFNRIPQETDGTTP